MKRERKRFSHDRELERMAKRLMSLPFNKNGADKSHALDGIFYWNDHFHKVKRRAIR